MSLDFYLTCSSCGAGSTDFNITHNLGAMAREAGSPSLYEALWRPNENGWETAGDLVGILIPGLAALKAEPARFKQFDAPNGWGTYEHFVPFVEGVLEACVAAPSARVSVWK